MKKTVDCEIKIKQHNYAVDLFRFVVILWIVLYHYTTRYFELGLGEPISFPFSFDNGGKIGVSLFFIVSGFYMRSTLESMDNGIVCYVRFVLKRYYRLWLPYALACLMIFVWLSIFPIQGDEISWSVLLWNLVSLIYLGQGSVDGAHWFLTSLFVIQAFIGFVLLLRKKQLRLYACMLIFALTIILGLFPNSLRTLHPAIVEYNTHLFEVLFGIMLSYLIKGRSAPVIVLVCLSIVVIAFNSIQYLIWVLVFMLLQTDTIRAISDKGAWLFGLMGEMSFFWYLVHQRIGYSIMSNMVGYHWVIVLGVSLFTTLVLAAVLRMLTNGIKNIIATNILRKRRI